MGLWAKSVIIFNSIREYGKQSIRSLADRTGFSKSSVHRHLQAMERRDRYPESFFWETEAGRSWLLRLVVATLFVFGLKRGVGAETLSEFFSRLHLDEHIGCSPSALRTLMHTLERHVLETTAAWEQEGIRSVEKVGRRYPIELLRVFGILGGMRRSPFTTPGVAMILQVLIAMVSGWINRQQQQVIDYQQEEIRILKAKLGGQRIRFTDAERRRLAALAFPIDRKQLKSLATLATPDTLMRWYKQLVAQKFEGSQKRNKLGRPRVGEEIEALVLQMANDNPTWGYRRIQGALANIGHDIDKITVRNILRRHHIDPAPKRRQGGMSWSRFLKMHWETLAATDFFTTEVVTWHGLVTYYVLVVMELSTRRVEIAGITPHPNAAFMQQCARQLTDPFDGFLLGKHYLIHDRDTKFTEVFDQFLRHEGIEPLVLPPRSPNLNAHCERFVRSIKEETLSRMIFIGEGSLCYATDQYMTHYHSERNHQGLENQLIAPEPGVGGQIGEVRRRERLGGVLSYYYREAA